MKEVIRLDGFDELDRAFQQLPAQMQRNVASSVVRKAAEPVLEQAITNAPVGDGTLSDSLKIRTKRDSYGVEAFVVADGNTAPHAYLVEFGHKIIFGKVGTKARFDTGKKVKGYPFMLPAFEARKNESLDILSKELGDALARAIQWVAKR